MADQPARPIDGALRSAATRAAREVAAGAYACLEICPWCKKSLGKVIPDAFCPSCHKDVLLWNTGVQEKQESQWKGVCASNAMDKQAKDAEIFRQMKEAGRLDKTLLKRPTNRE